MGCIALPKSHGLWSLFGMLALLLNPLAQADTLSIQSLLPLWPVTQAQPAWRFYQHPPTATNQTTAASSSLGARGAPRIAIIIDDLGHQHGSSFSSTQLPGDFTLAVMPFSPYAEHIVQWAHNSGKELMLHVPMEPEMLQAWDGGLTSAMDERQLRTSLSAMLDSLPSISGINNHMGSALTQNLTAMQWVMEELAVRSLYFIDSRTTAKTLALAAAQQRALPSAKRDVFLDNVRTSAAISVQFQKLLKMADNKGFAIGIGHPYPETLEFLQGISPLLIKHKVQLVPVSKLLGSPRTKPKQQARVEQGTANSIGS